MGFQFGRGKFRPGDGLGHCAPEVPESAECDPATLAPGIGLPEGKAEIAQGAGTLLVAEEVDEGSEKLAQGRGGAERQAGDDLEYHQ